MVVHSAYAPLKFLWLELTQRCNLVCGHCYNDSSPEKPLATPMQESDWASVISKASDQGVTDIQFIGGEPLLVKYIDRLIAFAHRLHLNIEVFTNATGITERHIDLFCRHNVSVATSFYSFDPEIHDNITSKRGSWIRTVNAIQMLVSSEIPLRAGIILTDENRDGYEHTRNFLSGLGVTDCGIDDVRAFGRASSYQVDDDEYFGSLCGQCGSNRACITGSGDIFPCVMSRSTVIGNFFESGLSLRRTELSVFVEKLHAAKSQRAFVSECTPNCWPHGGCAPHDVCNPHTKLNLSGPSAGAL